MSVAGIFLFSSLVLPTADAGWRHNDLEAQLAQQQVQIAMLEAKIVRLDLQIDALQQYLATQQAAEMMAVPSVEAGENNEAVASSLLQDAQQHLNSNNSDAARELLEIIEANHGQTRSASRAQRYLKELRTVGLVVPTTWSDNIDTWFQGSANLTEGTVLVVFWEEWCPHCKRELPELNETLDTLGPEGLQIVGLTRLTRDRSQEAVQQWMAEAGVQVPVAKEDGSLAEYFNVSGIPAAAVIQDGTIVWRGHPGRLNNTLLRGWL